jgi:tetratricopeptide (TPR) repeat protein
MHSLPIPRYWQLPLIKTLVFTCCLILDPVASWGQSTKAKTRTERIAINLVRPEYYAALDFLEEGQTEQAIIGFDQALQQSRGVDNERGIDSIPPLVMSGECLLMQGHIGMALEQYDSALALSVKCAGWLSLLGQSPQGKAEQRSRDISWGTENSRNADYYAVSDPWPIALGGADVLLETPSGRGVAAGKLVPIDAQEILRCQAIALRRRLQLMGPLTPHNPLTPTLPQAFVLSKDKQYGDTIRAGIALCSTLAKLGIQDDANALTAIRQFVALPSGQDHPLSAVALLSLADRAIDSNDLQSALDFAQEASLTAARAGQIEHVDEAIELWSKCVVHSDRDVASVNKTLQQVSKWSSGKSRLLGIRCQVEVVRQAALRGDSVAARKQGAAATSLLLPKQIVLPKLDAVVDYSLSRIAFLDGNIAQGVQKLEESLIPFMGDSQLDVGSPSLFQLRLLTRLMQNGRIADEVGIPVLGHLLQKKRPGHWRVHVQEQLAFQTADRSDATNLFCLRKLASPSALEHAEAADFLFAERFQQQSVLQGRLLEMRYAVHTDSDRWNPSQRSLLEPFWKGLQPLVQNAEKIRSWNKQFAQAAKYDSRKWTDEESKRLDAMLKLCTAQESLVWTTAVSPVSIPVSFPPRLDWQSTKSLFLDNDGIVHYVAIEGEMYGILYAKGEWSSWKINQSGLSTLLGQTMQMIRDGAGANQPELHKSLDTLRKAILPDPIWSKLLGCDRWVIVPDGDLWLLPFELLPLRSVREFAPAVSQHPITYLPTLGCAPLLLRKESRNGTPVVQQSPTFWSSKTEVQKSLQDRLVAIPHQAILDIMAVQNAPPSRCVKTTAPAIVSFLNTSWSDPNMILLGVDKAPNQGTLAAWNQLPWGTPNKLWLFGTNYTPDASIPTADAWRKLVLSLVAQGTEQMMIARWPVGGKSTMLLTESLADYSSSGRFSDSWQRSVAGLWAEELNPQDESILPKNGGGASRITGSLPMYWSGYVPVGDTSE